MKTRVIALSIFTMIIIIFTGCARVIEDYPSAVQWNDNVYIGSGNIISEVEIGNKIGSINRNVSKFPKNNGEANAYPAGSNIFEVKGFTTTKSIAVEENGQYRVFNKH